VEVVVDGRTGMVTPGEGATFRSIFDSLRKSISLRRRVIVGFTLDGENVTPEQEAKLGSQPTGTYGLLEVRTVDPFAFSLDTLTGLISLLRTMERTHDDASGFVASGEYTKALEKFDSCFQCWDILVRAVRDVGGITAADFRTLRAGGEPVQDRIRQLQDVLMRFAAAFEFKDVVRIGEIVKTELRPRLADWRSVLDALSQHVARLSGAAQA
jgi:hypothetical protein